MSLFGVCTAHLLNLSILIRLFNQELGHLQRHITRESNSRRKLFFQAFDGDLFDFLAGIWVFDSMQNVLKSITSFDFLDLKDESQLIKVYLYRVMADGISEDLFGSHWLFEVVVVVARVFFFLLLFFLLLIEELN